MTKTLHCIAGSITAGCFSTVIGHPLDTIKVHQQTKPHLSRASSLHVAKGLAKGDVFRLFKGIGPPMANQIIMNSVMFSVFHKVKHVANDSPLLDENSSALFAGLFSGFATACLSTPTDWIKIQAQLSLAQGGERPRTRTDFSSILRRGVLKDGRFQIMNVTRTLYRGHVANLGREGVFTMVYLGFYDRISNMAKGGKHNEDNQPLHMGTVVMISSLTGACAWICNYPFDTVKSVMQAGSMQEKMTTRSAIQSIYKSGGLKAFWRGVGSSTLRAMLVTSSRMLAYEKTIQILS
jgi:solute carrier family 25 carnitine/acylcarnitine transporter 20/29